MLIIYIIVRIGCASCFSYYGRYIKMYKKNIKYILIWYTSTIVKNYTALYTLYVYIVYTPQVDFYSVDVQFSYVPLKLLSSSKSTRNIAGLPVHTLRSIKMYYGKDNEHNRVRTTNKRCKSIRRVENVEVMFRMM